MFIILIRVSLLYFNVTITLLILYEFFYQKSEPQCNTIEFCYIESQGVELIEFYLLLIFLCNIKLPIILFSYLK